MIKSIDITQNNSIFNPGKFINNGLPTSAESKPGNDGDFQKSQFGMDPQNVPFEIVKLLSDVFTHYIDLTNSRLE